VQLTVLHSPISVSNMAENAFVETLLVLDLLLFLLEAVASRALVTPYNTVVPEVNSSYIKLGQNLQDRLALLLHLEHHHRL